MYKLQCKSNEYYKPMIILQLIANMYKSKIMVCVDKDNLICIHIPYIDRVYKRKYLSNLEGRGITYRDACINYIDNTMNRDFNIRYKFNLYATEPIRRIVRKQVIK